MRHGENGTPAFPDQDLHSTPWSPLCSWLQGSSNPEHPRDFGAPTPLRVTQIASLCPDAILLSWCRTSPWSIVLPAAGQGQEHRTGRDVRPPPSAGSDSPGRWTLLQPTGRVQPRGRGRAGEPRRLRGSRSPSPPFRPPLPASPCPLPPPRRRAGAGAGSGAGESRGGAAERGSGASARPGSVAGNRGGKGRGGRGSSGTGRESRSRPSPPRRRADHDARLARAACPPSRSPPPVAGPPRRGVSGVEGRRGMPRGRRGSGRGEAAASPRRAAERAVMRDAGGRCRGWRKRRGGIAAFPMAGARWPLSRRFPRDSSREYRQNASREEVRAAVPPSRAGGLRFGRRLRRRQQGVMDAPHAARGAWERRC